VIYLVQVPAPVVAQRAYGPPPTTTEAWPIQRGVPVTQEKPVDQWQAAVSVPTQVQAAAPPVTAHSVSVPVVQQPVSGSSEAWGMDSASKWSAQSQPVVHQAPAQVPVAVPAQPPRPVAVQVNTRSPSCVASLT
jgi:hypothetical protein